MKAAFAGLAAATTALGLVALSTVVALAGTVELVAELDNRPGNSAIGPSSEIYLSMRPFGAPEYSVVRLEDDGADAIGRLVTRAHGTGPTNTVIVALANKLARIAWATLHRNRDYDAEVGTQAA